MINHGVEQLSLSTLQKQSKTINTHTHKSNWTFGEFKVYYNSLHFQLVVKTKSGELVDRICPWSKVVKRPKDVPIFEQINWDPPKEQVSKEFITNNRRMHFTCTALKYKQLNIKNWCS